MPSRSRPPQNGRRSSLAPAPATAQPAPAAAPAAEEPKTTGNGPESVGEACDRLASFRFDPARATDSAAADFDRNQAKKAVAACQAASIDGLKLGRSAALLRETRDSAASAGTAQAACNRRRREMAGVGIRVCPQRLEFMAGLPRGLF